MVRFPLKKNFKKSYCYYHCVTSTQFFPVSTSVITTAIPKLPYIVTVRVTTTVITTVTTIFITTVNILVTTTVANTVNTTLTTTVMT